MPFDPLPGQTLAIEKATYQIAEHPAAPGIAYGQEGRAAVVYKLETAHQSYALKVFKSRFRLPTLASLADQLSPFASLPGLSVCRRIVLTPQRHGTLLRENPDLTYSVLMPWIEGPTWLQIVQDRREITQEQSLFLARSFAEILANLEQQGVAHCDLSAANLILPMLADQDQPNAFSPVELVDIEQLFASDLKRPAAIPSGSEGYAHLSVHQGVWEEKADRFAGAVLLAEFLGWSDQKVREAAWGESYFAPQEMQRSCTRFDLLHQSLAKNWGNGVAQLFINAWNSELLADCPTFGEWMVAIPDAPLPEENLKEQNEVVSPLYAQSEQMAAQNNVPEPVESDSSGDDAIEGSDHKQEPQSVDKFVEITTAETVAVENSGEASTGNDVVNTVAGLDEISCPFCQMIIPADAKVCPFCEKVIHGDKGETDINPNDKKEGKPTVPSNETEVKLEFTHVCQKCNYDVPNGVLICPNCGHSSAEPVSVNKNLLKDGDSDKSPLAQWIIWLFVFLGGIYLIVYTSMRNSRIQGSDPTPINASNVIVVQTKPTKTITPTKTVVLNPTLTLTNIPFDALPELAFFSNRGLNNVPYLNDHIYLINSNGTGLLRITNGSDIHKSPVWSPDGTNIAYSDVSDLWIMNADGSGKRKLTFDKAEKYPGGFTSDGKFLIYEKISSSPGIYSLNLENRQTVMVSNVRSSPTVSPDSMKIAYWNSDGYYVINLDGSENKLISRDVTKIRTKSIAWSPDGTILACVSKNNDIKLYGLDGSEIANLTNGEGNNLSPSFSPDGKFLSYTSDRFGNNEIFVLNLSNNVITRVTHNLQNDEGAVWRPTLKSSNITEIPTEVTDPLLFLGQSGARFVDPIGGAKLELIDGSTKLRFSVPNYRRDLDPGTNLQSPRLIIKSSQGMETKVQTRINSNGFQAAGLLAWINQGNFVWFGPSSAGLCAGVFINYVNSGNSEKCQNIYADTVGLRIERDGNSFNLSYSIQDGNWLPFDTISYISVPEQISSGLFLINQWDDVPYSADFYYFKNLP